MEASGTRPGWGGGSVSGAQGLSGRHLLRVGSEAPGMGGVATQIPCCVSWCPRVGNPVPLSHLLFPNCLLHRRTNLAPSSKLTTDEGPLSSTRKHCGSGWGSGRLGSKPSSSQANHSPWASVPHLKNGETNKVPQDLWT